MPLGRQGKRNHNICGVMLDCVSEVLQEYGLKYDRAFKIWNLALFGPNPDTPLR